MNRKIKRTSLPEWALQITALRDSLAVNQAELARRMECSAMTVSRWERGLLQPSAEHFIQLGNLGGKAEAWFFWEKAGIQPSKVVEALGGSLGARKKLVPQLTQSRRSSRSAPPEQVTETLRVPLLKAVVGSHGLAGDRHSSLRNIPVLEIVGAPASWCPNPAYTSLLRVKGRSMEPLIRDGDFVAIDTFQLERENLSGKIVIASSEQEGLCVSRLRRYDSLDVLEAEDHEYAPVILNKASGWRVVGKVLWWISPAP